MTTVPGFFEVDSRTNKETMDLSTHEVVFPEETEKCKMSNSKDDLLKNSTIVRKGKLSVHLLNMEEKVIDATHKIRKSEFGPVADGATEKVIMVVGATGAGKTTLLNGLVNYILGVEWTDTFRFQLIADENDANERSQAKSQTEWITSYTLHLRQNFKIHYTFTVIDTPGFGDTSGIERDQKITKQIRQFFTTQGANGIDHIDAIGFVAQASLPRLTPPQEYIFDSVLALFGKDISDNIFVLATFADAKKPPVLAAIKAAKIPYKKVLKFNNSALYAGGEENQEDQKKASTETDESDEDDDGFDEMYWAMGEKSFAAFFKSLNDTTSKSLLLTKDVLEERYRLETYVTGIHRHIDTGLNKLEQLRVEVNILKQHEVDIEQNKNYTYEVKEEVMKPVPNPPGTYVTNCLECNSTCHYPCRISEDKYKNGCAAMDREEGTCTVCHLHCGWEVHKNAPFRYEKTEVIKTKTLDELKERYQEARGEKMTKENLIHRIMNDFKMVQLRVVNHTNEVRKSLDRLKEIALKPNPLTTVQYIDILIEAETSRRDVGFRDRLRQLTEVRNHAKHLQDMARPNFDPFEQYQGIIKQVDEMQPKTESVFDKVKHLFSKNFPF